MNRKSRRQAARAGNASKKKGYTVHQIDSPAGQAQLVKYNLTIQDLATAIATFQKSENIYVGTLIGINKDGLFGSIDENWAPDIPDAFDQPLLSIPWVQIFELLGRVPENTTGEFLKDGGNFQ